VIAFGSAVETSASMTGKSMNHGVARISSFRPLGEESELTASVRRWVFDNRLTSVRGTTRTVVIQWLRIK
jgi:hypothetical protein